MINQEILEGLKFALSKGQTLYQAMLSFYNAGYKKEEIEEAAKVLHLQQEVHPPHAQTPVKTEQSKAIGQPKPTEQLQPEKKQSLSLLKRIKQKTLGLDKPKVTPGYRPHTTQVSGYDEKEKKTSKKLMILLIVLSALCLLGVLAAIIFFKQEVIDLFSSIF